MRIFALVMAGGQGNRMRHSFGPLPKPLVPVRGVPLLERNIIGLLNNGFRKIGVSVPHSIPAIGEFARLRGGELVRAFGGELHVIEEQEPLGNIGAVGLLGDVADAIVVVFADNLTTLNVQDLVTEHLRTGAALTLATHLHTFGIPFGKLRLTGDRVQEYMEKPVYSVQISSGLAVLSSQALAHIPKGRPTGLSELSRTLLLQGKDVRAFHHAATWIDVNDADAVVRAEALIRSEKQFECWATEIAGHALHLLIRSGDGILLVKDSRSNIATDLIWNMPSCVVDANSGGHESAAKHLLTTLGVSDAAVEFVSSFDDVDTDSGRVLRHHLYVASVIDPAAQISSANGRAAWVAHRNVTDESASPILIRALACCST